MEVRYLVPDTGLQEVVWDLVTCAADEYARGWWDHYARPGWRWHRRCVTVAEATAARPPVRALSLPVEIQLTPKGNSRTGTLRCRVNTSSESARAGNLWTEGHVLDLTFQLGLQLTTRPVVHLLSAATTVRRPKEGYTLFIDYGHTSTACLCLRDGEDPVTAPLFRQQAADWGAYGAAPTPSAFVVTPNRWRYRIEPAVVGGEVSSLAVIDTTDQLEPHPVATAWGRIEYAGPALRTNPKAGLGDPRPQQVRFTAAGAFADLAELPPVRARPDRLVTENVPGRMWTELALRGLFRAVYHELYGHRGHPAVQTDGRSALPVVRRVVLAAPAAFNDWARRDLHQAASSAIRAATPECLRDECGTVDVEIATDEATCIAFWAAAQRDVGDTLKKSPDTPLLVFDCGGGTTDVSLTTWTRNNDVLDRQDEVSVRRWFAGSVVCAGTELLWGVMALVVRELGDPAGDTRIDLGPLLGLGDAPSAADRSAEVPRSVWDWARARLGASEPVRGLGLRSDQAAAVRTAVTRLLTRYAGELIRGGDQPPSLDLSDLFGQPGPPGGVERLLREVVFPAVRLPGCQLAVSGSGHVVRIVAGDADDPRPRRADPVHEFRLGTAAFAGLFQCPSDVGAPDPFVAMLDSLLGPLRELLRRAEAAAARLAEKGSAGPKGTNLRQKKGGGPAVISPKNPLRIVFAGGGTQIQQVREQVRARFAAAVGDDCLASDAVEPAAPTPATPEARYLEAKSRAVRGLARLDFARRHTALRLDRAAPERLAVRLAEAVSGAPKPGPDAVVFAADRFEAAAARREQLLAQPEPAVVADLGRIGLGRGQVAGFRAWVRDVDEGLSGPLSRRLRYLFPDPAGEAARPDRKDEWRFLCAAAVLELVPREWLPLAAGAAELAFCLTTEDGDGSRPVEFLGRFGLREPKDCERYLLVTAPGPGVLSVLDVAGARYPLTTVPDGPGAESAHCWVSAWPAEALPAYLREG
jgi:hypothetical protein